MSLAPAQLDGQAVAATLAESPEINWSAVLSEHAGWLRTVVFARLGEPQAADDVMQELALAVLKQSSPLVDHTKLAPWLYRLAVTQALLYRRQHGRRRKLIDRYAKRINPADDGVHECDPLGWLLADERRRLVRTALSRLTGRDAEILLLKYTQDWTYHELADHLGISHSAVEARLHRARGRLRRELAALEIIEVEA